MLNIIWIIRNEICDDLGIQHVSTLITIKHKKCCGIAWYFGNHSGWCCFQNNAMYLLISSIGRLGLWRHSNDPRVAYDVIKWKRFVRYWPFVRWIHRSPVNSLHRGKWGGTLIFVGNPSMNNEFISQRVKYIEVSMCWRHCNGLHLLP